MSTGAGDPRIFADGSAAEGGNDGARTEGATLLRSSMTGLGGPVACSHQPVTIPARKQVNMAAIGNERAVFFLNA
jgi:hypothetical protein